MPLKQDKEFSGVELMELYKSVRLASFALHGSAQLVCAACRT